MLSLVGQLHHVDADKLGWWLCERQLPSGGLNGWFVLQSLLSVEVFYALERRSLVIGLFRVMI